jgi:ATP-binding protein involved in chromosome partitioning
MTKATVTDAAVREAIQNIPDPEIGRSLGVLEMLKQIRVEAGGAVRVEIELPTPAYPNRERISQAVQSAVTTRLPQAGAVEVSFSSRVRGNESGGKIGLRIKNVIAVGSGKGGVGKSTIAAALAYGFKHYGAKVGLMDADVYGPSIPHLVGAHGQPAIVERQTPDGQVYQRIEPVEADGLKLMSMGFLVKEDQAVIWRGPMLHKTLTQFLQQTEWGELDYLVIDMPPGTGDVALTLSQLLGLAGAVVVCTPQQVALLDAVKAINMYRQVRIPILGVVENMSGDIFGRGGAKQKAEQLGIPFLGEVPIEADIRIKGDAGRMSALFAEGNPARPHLLNITEQTAIQIARQLLETPVMPSLEIL